MLTHLIYLIAGELALFVGFVAGGYAIFAGPVLALKAVLATVTVWTVLSAVVPILAPLLALALTVLGKIIWNHEKRIRNLEQGKTRQSRTLYGDEDDPQQDGLAQDIKSLGERVDQLEVTIGELRDEIREMNGDD